jgi:hypothetical protein
MDAIVMPFKFCTGCGQVNAILDFHRKAASHDGHQAHCKTCQRAYCSKHYARNRDSAIARVKQWGESHPEAAKAHEIVNRAIRNGSLSRHRCEECGDPKAEAHHPDYLKPLEVIWLCRAHHKAIHLKNHDPRPAYVAVG